MLDIEKLKQEILAEFKCQPEFEKYDSNNNSEYLKNYDEYNFITKYLKIKLYTDDGKDATENYHSWYDLREKLIKLNKFHEFEVFNHLIDLYNEAVRLQQISLEKN